MPDIRGRAQILQHYVKDVKASKGTTRMHNILDLLTTIHFQTLICCRWPKAPSGFRALIFKIW
jgi:hypothetical protein